MITNPPADNIPRRAVAPCALLLLLLSTFASALHAAIPAPPSGADPTWLDFWTFTDTNTWKSDYNISPTSFTNIHSSFLGDGTALVVDSTNAAWLRFRLTETSGTNNLKLNQGTVMFWFAPSWAGTNAGGTGPGQMGRLIDVGSYTTNASYGWWSLFLDSPGSHIYFANQTNTGLGATNLSAPILWTTNRWHMIALTYSATNSLLYIDGNLATNGPGVAYWPNASVQSNGFYIGSASNGVAQAHGMFDDMVTFDYQINQQTIRSTYALFSIFYYFNPLNTANIVSAPSSPSPSTPTPSVFNAITGTGYLQAVSTNTTTCIVSSNLWITNPVVAIQTNGTANLTFTIAGGSNGLPYDVFASSVLGFGTNFTWAWMGQGYHCVTYTMTNLPVDTCFLMLGTPRDRDSDGLTDAYELLVTHTDPNNPDSNGNGILDGWEVLYGLNPLVDATAQAGQRSNYYYDQVGRLDLLNGIRSETLTIDYEGNITQAH